MGVYTSTHNTMTAKVRVVLLEGVSLGAVEEFKRQGYEVEYLKAALQGEELIEKIKDAHVVGVRSRTLLTAEVLNACENLFAIGCFCIGTNQVDLDAAASLGICVFNSPFCNTRSVAELIIAMVISLSRKLFDRSSELHRGLWNKTSSGCYEVRNKTVGIVGYGHIGTQLSVLAEGLGMTVIYHDIRKKMNYSKCQQVQSLEELLQQADFVTMHVPETPETKMMIRAEQFAKMKKGSYFLNASRGSVVDIPALAEALKSGHLAGAYVDVFPSEPKKNSDGWKVELQGIPNVIMTPHIGGSTEEAQEAIGLDVSEKIVRFIQTGDTDGSVNMPNITLPLRGDGVHRIVTIHCNEPGVLSKLDAILCQHNIIQCNLGTQGPVGYVMHQIEASAETANLKQQIDQLKQTIRCRILE